MENNIYYKKGGKHHAEQMSGRAVRRSEHNDAASAVLRIIEMRRIALLLCVILLPFLRKKLLPFFVRRLEGVVSRSRRPAVWQYAPLALETILVCALIAAYRTITDRTAQTCFILLFVVLTIFSYIWISAVHHIRKKDEE